MLESNAAVNSEERERPRSLAEAPRLRELCSECLYFFNALANGSRLSPSDIDALVAHLSR